jgi:hypothetical protein
LLVGALSRNSFAVGLKMTVLACRQLMGADASRDPRPSSWIRVGSGVVLFNKYGQIAPMGEQTKKPFLIGIGFLF